MSVPTQQLTAWTFRRQGLERRSADPLQALRDVVAVYSTHPTAPLALLARASVTPPDFTQLEQSKKVVRIVAMRGSAFLVPTESAAIILAATRMSADRIGGRLRSVGIELATYQRLAPRVLECCVTPKSRGQIRAEVGGPDDPYMVARVLAREGKILRVGAALRTDQLKYVATAAWLGSEFEEVDPGAALEWLAREYLRAFGPARVADFAWWAGLPRRAAQRALDAVRPVEREGLLMLEQDVDAFAQVQPLKQQAMTILPKWDSYTMGYAPDGRGRLIDDAWLPLAFTSRSGSPGATSGDGLPLILENGRAIATWSHRFSGNQMTITVATFSHDGYAPAAVDFARVAELLGAASVDVTWDPKQSVAARSS